MQDESGQCNLGSSVLVLPGQRPNLTPAASRNLLSTWGTAVTLETQLQQTAAWAYSEQNCVEMVTVEASSCTQSLPITSNQATSTLMVSRHFYQVDVDFDVTRGTMHGTSRCPQASNNHSKSGQEESPRSSD